MKLKPGQVSVIFVGFVLALCFAPQRALAQPMNQGGPGVQSPVVETDGKVTFSLSAPKAGIVLLQSSYPITTGGMSAANPGLPMKKNEQGIWSITVGPLKPDIYQYSFNVDGVNALDPQNVHVEHNSNWVLVPGRASENYRTNEVPHGDLSYVWYPSPTLKLERRRLIVYTPPGYGTGSGRYPVLYAIHGGGSNEYMWINGIMVPEILDNLIAQGKAQPMIVVMPDANFRKELAESDNIRPPVGPDRGPGGVGPNGPGGGMGGGNRFSESVVKDIIPFIDIHYRTRADRDDRSIVGVSVGGVSTLQTWLSQDENDFAWVGLFSPGLAASREFSKSIPMPADAASRRGPDVGKTIDQTKFTQTFPALNSSLNQRTRLLYVSIGDSDGLLEAVRDFRKLLDDKSVKYTWEELPDYGHEGRFWRMNMEDFASRIFQPGKVAAGSATTQR